MTPDTRAALAALDARRCEYVPHPPKPPLRRVVRARRRDEKLKCIEIAAARAVRRMKLPGDPHEQWASMLGVGWIVLRRFQRHYPWNPGRFVEWAWTRIRDELARDHGLRYKGKKWTRREHGSEALEELTWDYYRESA